MLQGLPLGRYTVPAFLDLPIPTDMTTTETVPALKPGKSSSEFTGKITMQVVLGIVALTNLVLEQLGHDALLMDAETAALIAIALEALWALLRQGNKALEIRAQRDVAVAKINQEKA